MTEETKIPISRDLVERMRNALYVVKQQYPHLTLRSCVEIGATRIVEDLERTFNHGKPFPRRNGDLPKTRFKKKEFDAPTK